ncbi:neurotensin receptor type 1-like [Xenopus tropicalis]|uniref:Neurotensin receptor type 1-like n=1 Tax=Xenopus tropicalis TaxID=8364 RepID=A0A8J1JN54_XENTR|nr:neurotensin receptor type 1-like [Xenopus tropicalis]
MVVISVLNTIIANQLIIMVKQAHQENQVCTIGGQQTVLSMSIEPSRIQSLKHGVRVLRVVVIAFVVCWLPYHVRRLMFCYVPEEMWSDELNDFFLPYLLHVDHVLFYVSSTVNPSLNLVSAISVRSSSLRSVFYAPWKRKKKRPAFTRNPTASPAPTTLLSTITRETPTEVP